jgi:pyrrolidone-carboxylate peptidase
MFLRSLFTTLAFILFLFGICAFATTSQANLIKPSLLLTAFDPFGVRTENHSIPVATALAEILDEHFNVKLCILPTVYDQASNQALTCYQEMEHKPQYAISLGEGGFSCKVELVEKAENFDDSLGYDNWGQTRENQTILPGHPTWLPLKITPEQLLQSVKPENRDQIRLTLSAGNFVCNNTAYRLAHSWQEGQSPLFTFIHVPNSGCDPLMNDPNNVAEILADMILGLPRAVTGSGIKN